MVKAYPEVGCQARRVHTGQAMLANMSVAHHYPQAIPVVHAAAPSARGRCQRAQVRQESPSRADTAINGQLNRAPAGAIDGGRRTGCDRSCGND